MHHGPLIRYHVRNTVALLQAVLQSPKLEDETWTYARASNEKELLLQLVSSESARSYQAMLFTTLGGKAGLHEITAAVIRAASQTMAAHGRMMGLEHVCRCAVTV